MTVSEPQNADVIRAGADGGDIIDGKIAAAQVIAEVTERTRALAAKGVKPGLAVVLVGENPASQVYVKAKGEALDWRKSIVDLMKALDIDSSLTARKELAKELHYTGDTNDSATMNIWLHKQVIAKVAANGGKVPDELK